jgi:hypothetical protein
LALIHRICKKIARQPRLPFLLKSLQEQHVAVMRCVGQQEIVA